MGAVRDPRAGDVAHARPRGRRPRQHDPDPGPLEQRAQTERDGEVQLRLARPGDDPARATAVEDLEGRGARADRLRPQIRVQVMAGVDDDGDPGTGARRHHDQRDGEREEREAYERAAQRPTTVSEIPSAQPFGASDDHPEVPGPVRQAAGSRHVSGRPPRRGRRSPRRTAHGRTVAGRRALPVEQASLRRPGLPRRAGHARAGRRRRARVGSNGPRRRHGTPSARTPAREPRSCRRRAASPPARARSLRSAPRAPAPCLRARGPGARSSRRRPLRRRVRRAPPGRREPRLA